jgi:hypothetical protein
MAPPREHLRWEVEEAAREPRQVLEDRGATGELSDHGWWSRLRRSGPTLRLLGAAAAELSDHAAAGRGVAAELSDHAAAGRGGGGAVRPRSCWARQRRSCPTTRLLDAAEERSNPAASVRGRSGGAIRRRTWCPGKACSPPSSHSSLTPHPHLARSDRVRGSRCSHRCAPTRRRLRGPVLTAPPSARLSAVASYASSLATVHAQRAGGRGVEAVRRGELAIGR